MQALMQEGRGKGGRGSLLDDLHPALTLLNSKVDDWAPLATWTVPQVFISLCLRLLWNPTVR